MAGKSEIGRLGEDIACKYLEDKKYQILTRNYRKPWGEIDIVARAPDRTLVFVEVKTLRCAKNLNPELSNSKLTDGLCFEELKPEDQMKFTKLKKFKRICESFCTANPSFIDEKKGWRIDFVAIEIYSAGSHSVRHYEGI